MSESQTYIYVCIFMWSVWTLKIVIDMNWRSKDKGVPSFEEIEEDECGDFSCLVECLIVLWQGFIKMGHQFCTVACGSKRQWQH